MHRMKLLLGGRGAQVEALLDLHDARDLPEFWAAARKVCESALSYHSSWFEPSPSLPFCGRIFAHGRRFTSDEEFRGFCDAHPGRSFLLAHPEQHVVRLSDLTPYSKLRQTSFYREYMAEHEEGHAVVLEIGCRDRERFIGLHRREEEGDFSLSEMSLLEELQQQLAGALHQVRVLEAERQARQSLASLFSQLPLATLVLDWDLEVLYCSPAAGEMLKIWEKGDEGARFLKKAQEFQLPADILEHCRLVKSQWVPPKRRASARSIAEQGFSRPGLPALRVSVRPLQMAGTAYGYPALVITFENLRPRGRPGKRRDRRCFSEMAHLTPRERDVALLVCDGNSDKEVAARLGKSVATVKKQLGAIYQKLEVPGRSKLTALLRE